MSLDWNLLRVSPVWADSPRPNALCWDACQVWVGLAQSAHLFPSQSDHAFYSNLRKKKHPVIFRTVEKANIVAVWMQ